MDCERKVRKASEDPQTQMNNENTQTHTLGSDVREPELCVVIVRTVVMPRATLAGAASMLIQKETQERMTMSREGMYIWIR